MDKVNFEAQNLTSSTSAQPSRIFTIAEIQSATNNFDDKLVIGHGGFGKVYKGQISVEESSHFVAIKRLDSMSNQGEAEFKAEIQMLSKLRHCNLVSLIGYCDDNREMILVYVYMPRGTLYDHLHKVNDTPLSWIQRLKIAIGAGRGLDYLHTGFGTQHGVIHRDVKSSNILLDENWAAMISDFGLSKIGPIDQASNKISISVKGTFGYLDPEYFYTSKLTRKTDVYAFGVILFELLSGRLAVDRHIVEEQGSLARWAQKCVKEKRFDQVVDSNITGTIAPKCLRGFAKISYRCLLRAIEKRPSMTKLVAKLQDLLELQEKYDISANSTGMIAFTWKIHKYLVLGSKQISGEPVARDVKMFTYSELEHATGNFESSSFLDLGNRKYGMSYEGWVDELTYSPCEHHTGLPIVVKRVHDYKPFDIDMLEFRNPNLVKLIGYCLNKKQLLLVYESRHNQNFHDLLRSGAVAQLPLVTKVKMAVGIARGIVFLNQTEPQVGVGLNCSGTVGESSVDRHQGFLDEDSRKKLHDVYTDVNDADDFHYDSWFETLGQKTRLSGRDLWAQTVSESWLNRRNILLDEDFTVKLSDYDVTKLVHGRYPHYTQADKSPDSDFYYHMCGPIPLQSNISGFTVVFLEVVTGRKISQIRDFINIRGLLRQSGKKSLVDIAKLCFKICNEVDSESIMMTVLEEYDNYFKGQNTLYYPNFL